jgi:hypothetical protein
MNPMRGFVVLSPKFPLSLNSRLSAFPEIRYILGASQVYPWGTASTYYRSHLASGRPLDIQLLPRLKSIYGRWDPSQAALEDAWTFFR